VRAWKKQTLNIDDDDDDVLRAEKEKGAMKSEVDDLHSQLQQISKNKVSLYLL
jgi:hypothetical protein